MAAREYGQISTGVVQVLRGPGDLLGRFATTFHLAG